MKQAINDAVTDSYNTIASREGYPPLDSPLEIIIPKQRGFGDFSCNVAMILAKKLKQNPRDIAAKLCSELKNQPLLSDISVAGPGFINMTVDPLKWIDALGAILIKDKSYGALDVGKGRSVMVEFVSANPTGPLHIGHGRGAAVGDCIARILRKAGYDVHSEYYLNDVGLQMDNLGMSAISRARELSGLSFEEQAYKGDYIKEIAGDFLKEYGEGVLENSDLLATARKFTAETILEGIRNDLGDFRVFFNEWFSEATLHEEGEVDKTIDSLLGNSHIYEKEEALWLKTEPAGDEKDRVVRRANGITTYLAADMAYHKNKLDRGFDLILNIWGADHHGYIPRMKAVMMALGADPDRLEVRLVQMVSLKRGGAIVPMSTRSGVFTTLREIIDEVGVDATRYFFLMRSSDSHLDFDVDLAKKRSDENPVFYIQYAHARCVNIFATARERKVKTGDVNHIDKSHLNGESQLRLIRKLLELPDVVAYCARTFQPHPLTGYLTELSAAFHQFYSHNRVVSEDPERTKSLLALVDATRITLRNGLELLGVTAPDRM